jgi:hypothetical protein
VDRGKQGLKRSVATEATGIPLAAVSAPANRHDSPLLGPTLDQTLATLDALGPRPASPGCTERNTPVVAFWLCLAHAIITLGRLLRQAWTCYRWETRPRRRP